MPVVVGKLLPPEASPTVVVRERLLRQFTDETRVLSIVAPAGYGKTILAKQIAIAEPRHFMWFNVDLLDDDPSSFWLHLITALRWAQPSISENPERLLRAHGPHDPAFLMLLITEIEVEGTPAVLVIDGVSRLADSSVVEGLGLLIERIGDLVRFVLVGRSLPELPIGRWRANGWVRDVGVDDLRFDADDAVAIAAALPAPGLDRELAVALNRRVEGWPTGFVLAAQSVADATDRVSAVAQLRGSDRLFAEYFATELLDRLDPAERRAALALSVLDEFDAELCCDLLGSDAVPLVHELPRRRGLLAVADPGTGMIRWHPLLREMMEHELRWLDPELRRTLHRRASDLCMRRKDLSGAHAHLRRVGDAQAAFDLVVQPVLSLVNRGDRHGLAQLKRLLPRAMRTSDATFAFDVAAAWVFIGNLDEAGYWCERGQQLMVPNDDQMRRRWCTTCGMVALLRGEIAVAEQCVAEYAAIPDCGEMGPLEERFGTTAARVMLAAGRLHEAGTWVDQVVQLAGPPVVVDVNAPALAAWLAFERGRLGRARELAESACAKAEELAVRPHHGSSEALVVAGWCRLASGDLVGAAAKADAAAIDAEILGAPWNRIRSGLLGAELRRLSGEPRAALLLLRDLRADIAVERSADASPGAHLVDEIAATEALALIDCGDLAAAGALVEQLREGPQRHLLTARVVLHGGEPPAAVVAAVVAALGDRRGWNRQHHLHAEALLAVAEAASGSADAVQAAATRLTAALQEGEVSGWVLPFLGHGAALDALLQELPVATLHPALARTLSLAAAEAPQAARAPHDRLTPRELRLLHFLPTHLSYAEIGERLFISVNTVKTNLKTLYRKLGATTRAEAVELAANAGFLDPHPS